MHFDVFYELFRHLPIWRFPVWREFTDQELSASERNDAAAISNVKAKVTYSPCMLYIYMPTLTPQTTPMYANVPYMECLGYLRPPAGISA